MGNTKGKWGVLAVLCAAIIIGVLLRVYNVNVLGLFETEKSEGNINNSLVVHSDDTFELTLKRLGARLTVQQKYDNNKGYVVIEKGDFLHTYEIEQSEIINMTEGIGIYEVRLFKVNDNGEVTQSGEVDINIKNKPTRENYIGSSYYTKYNTEDAVLNAVINDMAEGTGTTEEYIENCFKYISSFKYDRQKEEDITTGKIERYRPNITETLTNKSGVCIDKAAALATLLRANGIQTRLVFGYLNEQYHAWVEVEETQGSRRSQELRGSRGSQVAHRWRLLDPTVQTTQDNETTSENEELTYRAVEYH